MGNRGFDGIDIFENSPRGDAHLVARLKFEGTGTLLSTPTSGQFVLSPNLGYENVAGQMSSPYTQKTSSELQAAANSSGGFQLFSDRRLHRKIPTNIGGTGTVEVPLFATTTSARVDVFGVVTEGFVASGGSISVGVSSGSKTGLLNTLNFSGSPTGSLTPYIYTQEYPFTGGTGVQTGQIVAYDTTRKFVAPKTTYSAFITYPATGTISGDITFEISASTEGASNYEVKESYSSKKMLDGNPTIGFGKRFGCIYPKF